MPQLGNRLVDLSLGKTSDGRTERREQRPFGMLQVSEEENNPGQSLSLLASLHFITD